MNRPPYDVDPRHVELEPVVPEYEPEPFPVGWDVLAAVVIAGACIAFAYWLWLR